MKGLLIKDIKLMKNQKMFFLVLIFVGLVFLITQDNPYMEIGYVTVMISMFTITTLSYDEFDNGCAYLFTLPFDRKAYVKEKYMFGLLTGVGGLIVSVIAGTVVSFVKMQILEMPMKFEWMSVGIISLVAITMCVYFLALSIPIEIKFGVEKGRMGFLLVMVLFFVGFYLVLLSVEKISGRNPLEFIEKITSLHMTVIVGILAVTWIIFISISMLVSIRFISRKEY